MAILNWLDVEHYARALLIWPRREGFDDRIPMPSCIHAELKGTTVFEWIFRVPDSILGPMIRVLGKGNTFEERTAFTQVSLKVAYSITDESPPYYYHKATLVSHADFMEHIRRLTQEGTTTDKHVLHGSMHHWRTWCQGSQSLLRGSL